MDVCFTEGMWFLHLALRPTPYRVKTVLAVSKPVMVDRITLAEFQRVCFLKVITDYIIPSGRAQENRINQRVVVKERERGGK